MGRTELILASGSPRRRELLTLAGISFELGPVEIDETPQTKESPLQLVKRLSQQKALASFQHHQRQFFYLSADTIVVSPQGKVFGKPKGEKEATRMLKALSGTWHTVISGVAVLDARKSASKHHVFCVKTRVRFRPLSRSDIQGYLATGEPWDKAGAYAAQGAGMTLVQEIRGSFTNVVGLPMAETLALFKKIGIR